MERVGVEKSITYHLKEYETQRLDTSCNQFGGLILVRLEGLVWFTCICYCRESSSELKRESKLHELCTLLFTYSKGVMRRGYGWYLIYDLHIKMF